MKLIKIGRFSHFKRALTLVYSSSPGLTIANFFLTFIQSIFPLIIIYLIKELIDAVGIALSASDKDLAFQHVKLIVILSGVTFLINALANSISQYVREYQAQLFSDYMYDRLHKKAVTLDLEFFENPAYHDMFFRALQDSPYRPVKIVNNVFFMTQNLLAIIILSVLLISLHWSIAIVLLIATIPNGLIRLRYAGKLYNWQKDNTQNERKANYFSRVLTGDVFAKELRLFKLNDYFINSFSKLRNNLRVSKLSILKRKTFSESGIQFLAASAIFFTYGFIAYKAVYAALSVGALVMYFMALQRGMSYFKEMLDSFASLYEDNLYVSNLVSFLELKNNTDASIAIEILPQPIKQGIVFQNVSFQYPNSNRKALNNINMIIAQGTTVAIVGDNGAGKTTLIKLLCHLYEANSGQILIDGKNINTINDKDIKSNISVLFQDFVLYHLTARENIGFGDVDKMQDDEGIRQAAQKAGINDLIQTLRNKYDTVLGRLFDESEELSIGEWQKIAMARAFFKDAQVIILDEPTSALDPTAEYEVFKQFKAITKGKTSVIVSHRFSTVKMADYIYVMEKEKIVEEGTHKNLIQLNGKYARMFMMQASNYQ